MKRKLILSCVVTVARGRSRGPVFGVLIALVIVITCGIMLPYRNITRDSPLNKTEVRYGRERFVLRR